MFKTKNIIIYFLLTLLFGTFILIGCKQTYIDFSTLSYVVFGDSITKPQKYAPIPYSETVKDELGLKSVQNLGVSGTTLAYGVKDRGWIYEQLDTAGEADIISLLGGVNDYSAGTKLGNIDSDDVLTIYGGLKKIVGSLKEKYPNKFIFLMTPLKCISRTGKNSAGIDLEDIAEAIKNVGKKYSILVLDLYNECEFSRSSDSETSDGLHPSQTFITKKLSPVIINFIKKYCKL